jgi:hypothetical protein
MFQKTISLIAIAMLALACSANASLTGKTAANAKTSDEQVDDAQQSEIKALRAKIEKLEKSQASSHGGHQEEVAKTAAYLDRQKVDQPPPIVGPRCGMYNTDLVAYVGEILPDSLCRGNCLAIKNDTQSWMSIRHENGNKILICADKRSPYLGTVPTPGDPNKYQEISGVPPGAKVNWVNFSGTKRFVKEFWSEQPDHTVANVPRLTKTFEVTFPAILFGNIDPWGANCTGSGTC